jgi:hypothetical protein
MPLVDHNDGETSLSQSIGAQSAGNTGADDDHITPPIRPERRWYVTQSIFQQPEGLGRY